MSAAPSRPEGWLAERIQSVLGALIGLIVLVPQRQTLRNMLMKAALVFLFVISPLTLISLYTVAGASLWAGDRGAGETRADAVGDKPSLHPEGHVYLIIFDEMSYEYLYEEGTVKSAYPNFRAFSDMADNYHDAQAPGANTMTSIPALLNLKEGQRTKVIGDRLYLMEKGRAPLEFSPTPDNVFSTARAKGYGTALYGWYHDYCGIFKGLLDACRSYSIYNYSSSARGFSPLNAVFTNFNLWPYVFPAGYLKNLTAAPFHRNNAYSALGHALKTIDMEGSYFFFIHFGVPHNPFVFDAAGFNPPADPFNPSEKNYVNQLAYVDRIFGEFLERMREAGKLESSTIIVASDHNFRKRTPKERHKNVPLIVKRKGQGERMDFTEPALLISVVRETLAR